MTLLSGEMQRRPTVLRLAVDKSVLLQKRLTNVHAAVLGRQVQRGLALVVEYVHSAGVVQKHLNAIKMALGRSGA